jgi:hypothetical protein
MPSAGGAGDSRVSSIRLGVGGAVVGDHGAPEDFVPGVLPPWAGEVEVGLGEGGAEVEARVEPARMYHLPLGRADLASGGEFAAMEGEGVSVD